MWHQHEKIEVFFGYVLCWAFDDLESVFYVIAIRQGCKFGIFGFSGYLLLRTEHRLKFLRMEPINIANRRLEQIQHPLHFLTKSPINRNKYFS